jgi:hypothetical protein
MDLVFSLDEMGQSRSAQPDCGFQHERNDGRRTDIWMKRKVPNLNREEGCPQVFSSL